MLSRHPGPCREEAGVWLFCCFSPLLLASVERRGSYDQRGRSFYVVVAAGVLSWPLMVPIRGIRGPALEGVQVGALEGDVLPPHRQVPDVETQLARCFLTVTPQLLRHPAPPRQAHLQDAVVGRLLKTDRVLQCS